MKDILSIPNLLSIFRIILIPFMVIAYVIGRYYFLAGLIALSAATDVLDGIIARKFNMVTSLGKALDPIADKLTLFTLLILLCNYLHSIPIIILCVIFAVKEFVMGIEGLLVIKATGTTYSANIVGKITTVVLYLNIFTHIIWSKILPVVSHILIGVSIVLVCVSLAVYTTLNVKRIRKKGVYDKK